jgi:hypothetical protein
VTTQEVKNRRRTRALDALRMRESGLKLREIGEKLGSIEDGKPLGRERARQMVVLGRRFRDKE